MLYRSNKVMYDRLTGTLWSQLRGEPIVGELVGSGIALEVLPVALTTWGEWLAEHPGTLVMSPQTGLYPSRTYRREDDNRAIYYAYRQDADTMFPVWNRDDRLPPKQLVLGVSIGSEHKAYPVPVLRQTQIVHDNVDGADIVVVASALSSDALVFLSDGMRFALPDDPLDGLPHTLIDADGGEWQVRRDAIVNAADPSQSLPAHQANVVFWFGWYATHPDTLLYEAP